MTLRIPADALINRGVEGRKYRANKAEVIFILPMEGTFEENKAYSIKDPSFSYQVGDLKEVSNFDTSDAVCAPGIHFFLTPREALEVANYGI